MSGSPSLCKLSIIRGPWVAASSIKTESASSTMAHSRPHPLDNDIRAQTGQRAIHVSVVKAMMVSATRPSSHRWRFVLVAFFVKSSRRQDIAPPSRLPIKRHYYALFHKYTRSPPRNRVGIAATDTTLTLDSDSAKIIAQTSAHSPLIFLRFSQLGPL